MLCFALFQISSMIDEDIRVDLLNTKQRNLPRPLVRLLIDDPSLLISPNDSHSNHGFYNHACLLHGAIAFGTFPTCVIAG